MASRSEGLQPDNEDDMKAVMSSDELARQARLLRGMLSRRQLGELENKWGSPIRSHFGVDLFSRIFSFLVTRALESQGTEAMSSGYGIADNSVGRLLRLGTMLSIDWWNPTEVRKMLQYMRPFSGPLEMSTRLKMVASFPNALIIGMLLTEIVEQYKYFPQVMPTQLEQINYPLLCGASLAILAEGVIYRSSSWINSWLRTLELKLVQKMSALHRRVVQYKDHEQDDARDPEETSITETNQFDIIAKLFELFRHGSIFNRVYIILHFLMTLYSIDSQTLEKSPDIGYSTCILLVNLTMIMVFDRYVDGEMNFSEEYELEEEQARSISNYLNKDLKKIQLHAEVTSRNLTEEAKACHQIVVTCKKADQPFLSLLLQIFCGAVIDSVSENKFSASLTKAVNIDSMKESLSNQVALYKELTKVTGTMNQSSELIPFEDQKYLGQISWIITVEQFDQQVQECFREKFSELFTKRNPQLTATLINGRLIVRGLKFPSNVRCLDEKISRSLEPDQSNEGSWQREAPHHGKPPTASLRRIHHTTRTQDFATSRARRTGPKQHPTSTSIESKEPTLEQKQGELERRAKAFCKEARTILCDLYKNFSLTNDPSKGYFFALVNGAIITRIVWVHGLIDAISKWPTQHKLSELLTICRTTQVEEIVSAGGHGFVPDSIFKGYYKFRPSNQDGAPRCWVAPTEVILSDGVRIGLMDAGQMQSHQHADRNSGAPPRMTP